VDFAQSAEAGTPVAYPLQSEIDRGLRRTGFGQHETFDGHDQIGDNCRYMAQPNVSSSHRPLLPREHEVQVLDCGAGCAFAKIIENRGQQDVPVFLVRKYA
jgi:hypothetical protein